MSKKILIAIDGSDISTHAMQETIKLMKEEQVQLLILHVVEVHFMFPGIDYISLLSHYTKEGQIILENAKKLVTGQPLVQCDTKLMEHNLLQGRISEAIVNEAKSWSADLIALGTHGRRGFNRLFLGSVAENTVRIATNPVLLIPPPTIN
ncbi:universal stress protein [Legionella sp. PATHC035]|uniref:universal stress protein n=1 Tax=Legionella sp. PATHC035 TaxID=2992040 RepID=UPI0022430A63|nr:universal stress protein [Legionella sp. PATHC035]MCW8409988.1 universal stress protein [Legionella sp. PATHC035]